MKTMPTATTKDFLPVFIEREKRPGHVIRWGLMPIGPEKPLGTVGMVPLKESLSNYKAALHRTRIVYQDRVMFLQPDGVTVEELNWDGEAKSTAQEPE
jgi:hypothetical protein